MPTYPRPVPQPAKRHPVRPLVALCVLGACVALAACGGSGSGSSSAGKSSTSSANKSRGPGSARFSALRACLQKEGITLPSRRAVVPGRPGAPGGGPPSGEARGFQVPKGVSQAKFQAALKKCGGPNLARGRARGLNSAAARAGLAKYAACLRQNGIDVPAPNTTGKGPVFNTNGIDTSSSKFKAAQVKCQSQLRGVFPGGARGGRPPAGGAGAQPPSGAGAPPAGANVAP